jgi:hypothetical protein
MKHKRERDDLIGTALPIAVRQRRARTSIVHLNDRSLVLTILFHLAELHRVDNGLIIDSNWGRKSLLIVLQAGKKYTGHGLGGTALGE